MNTPIRSLKTVLLYGFFIWLIPFAVAFLLFPLRESGHPLFETIMPVTLTFCVVFFSVRYFRTLESNQLIKCAIVGSIWFAISLVIDLSLFMWGPMKMTFIDYMADIGLTYLIFPIVTVGMGWLLERGRSST